MHKLNLRKLLINLVSVDGTLSQRVIRGGVWVFTLRIAKQIFSLVRLVILARILAPHDFGLMGIALLTMTILETFSQTGFQTALIQKKGDIESYLNAGWTVLILRGFILFAILYLIAPYASIFFNTPEAKPIIQVIGFSLLFQAFTNIGFTYFLKELKFDKQFTYELTGTLADFIVAILAVLILRNVWALVLGLLAGNAVRCFVSYLIHPYRPRLSFHLGKAKELWGFGRWILGSSILIFLLTNGDNICVGKILGATALGFYQMAYRISNMPATEITHVISQVTFPAYSKLQDDLVKLREAYLKVLQVTAFLSFPIAGLIFILAPDFTMVFLGKKWMPMVPALQVLCILGTLRAIAAASGPVFLALGRPDIEAKLPAGQLVLLAILIYPLTTKWGIAGTAASVSIVSFSFIFIILSLIIRLLKMKKNEILKFIKFILFPLLIIVTLFPLKMFILKPMIENNILFFSITILISIIIYLIGVYVLDRYLDYNMVNNLKYILERIRV